jgi:multiple sugar transport system permease protein
MSVVLASVWLWTPFVTICVLAGLQTIPPALYEAARVDGAGPMARFVHVTLPQLKPVLTVVVLLRAVWMFNKFDIIWLLTRGGPLGATEHLPILAYRKAFSLFDVGGGAAVATVSFLILMTVVTIYIRLFPLEERR